MNWKSWLLLRQRCFLCLCLVIYSKDVSLGVMVGIVHSFFLDPIMDQGVWFWTLYLAIFCVYQDIVKIYLLSLFLGFKKLSTPLKTFLQYISAHCCSGSSTVSTLWCQESFASEPFLFSWPLPILWIWSTVTSKFKGENSFLQGSSHKTSWFQDDGAKRVKDLANN